jgi:hypothetical protein
MRSLEEWEADPGQDAACDAALAAPLPSAAALILAEMRAEATTLGQEPVLPNIRAAELARA